MSKYIDRNELLKTINENIAEAHNERCAQVLEAILNAPTADVEEVRHGEWLEQFKYSRLVKCSVCGYEYCDLIECDNYCGHCGAKMDGERKDENGT